MAGLFSCRQGEDPGEDTPVYANLFVRYLQMEDELKVQASFREGDSLQTARPISIEGGVFFQGSSMPERNLQGQMIRYQLDRTGPYKGAFDFRLADEEGRRRSYSCRMTPVEDFRIDNPIRSDRGATLTVVNGRLEAGESLVLLFTDEQNQAASLTIEGPTDTGSYQLTPAQLQNWGPGAGQLYLVKKQTRDFQDGHYQVRTEVEYYTRTALIEVRR